NQINKATQLSLERSVKVTERANSDLHESNEKLEETQRALQVSLQTTQTALQRSLLAEENAQRASRLSDSLATLLGYSSEALSTSLLAENLAETNPNLSLQLSNYAYENYGVELTRKNLVKRWINNDLHQKAVTFTVGEILTVETGPFDNLALTGGQDGEVLLWKIEEGEVIQRYRGHTGPIIKALFSTDGTKVITASKDATIRLWDINSGILLQTLTGHIGPIYDLALSPNGQQFASIGEDQNIIFWDINSGIEVNRIMPSNPKLNGISCLRFSPNGEHLLAGGIDGKISLIHLITNQIEYFFYGHQDWVHQIDFLQNGNQFVSASKDGLAILWDLNSGRFVRSFVGHQGAVLSAIELPNTNLLITGSEDQEIIVWNSDTGKAVGSPLKGHLGPVNKLAILPNSNYLLSCSQDNSLQVWDVKNQQLKTKYAHHRDPLTAAQFTSVEDKVISGHQSGNGYIWSISSGKLLFKLLGHSRAIRCLASSQNDQRIVTGGLDGKMILRDEQGATLKSFTMPGKIPIHAIAINKSGTVAATASADHVIRIWDLERDSILHVFTEHTQGINVLSFNPEEDFLVSGSEDQTLILWDYHSGYQLRTINTATPITCLSFSPRGSQMAIGLGSGDCQIINYLNGEGIQRLSGHSLPLKTISFSEDGNRILIGASDNTISFWHQDGSLIKTFNGHQGSILALGLQEQDNQVLSVSQDQTVRSWNYPADNSPKSISLDNKILAMAEHPDSSQQLLAVSMTGDEIKIINPKSGIHINTLRTSDYTKALSLAFHPTLPHLYAGLEDGSIRKWTVNNSEFDREILDEEIRIATAIDTIFSENNNNLISRVDTVFVSRAFPAYTTVNTIAISSDGAYLLAGAENGEVKRWDLLTGKLEKTYSAHRSSVTTLAIHPGERFFITGSK
ncbi:MAG: WD40 repeat domain-containing protein, partial [Bacteroidota bacterium]